MKNITKALILAAFLATSLGLVGTAFAYSPYLSVSGSTISISGAQPNAAVVISYMPSGSNLTTTITGTTDYNGNFSTQASSVGSQVTATVGGQQVYAYNNGSGCGYYGCSSGGCTYNCGSPYGLSLSQSSVSLSAGQSVIITAYNSGSNYYNANSLYVSSNSNPSVASASANGSQVTIYGITSGSDTISICQNSGSAGCASVYVTVSGPSCTYYGCSNGTLSLSQTSLNLTSPQTATVSIYGSNYSGGYYISSNSVPSIATASVSGSTLYIGSLVGGNTTITVCQSGNSGQCASLYVTVNGGGCSIYGCGGSGSLSLSQTSLSLTSPQTASVSIYGSGSYYVSSNSTPNVATASISGNTLYVSSLVGGSTTISVCQSNYSGQCASLYVTVNGGSCSTYGCGGTGALSLSQTSFGLTVGQNVTVSAYNTSGLYVSSNSNSSVVSVTSSGNQAIFYGLANGSSTVILCGTSSSQCASVYVTVSGNNGCTYNCGLGAISFSPSSVNINLGQSSTVNIYNSYSAGSFYISSNSNSSVASASISGNSLYLLAGSVGSTTITVCQNGISACGTLYVNVNSLGGSGNTLSLSQSTVNLSYGQTVAVTAYNGSGIYISSNSNPSVASYSISGNQINIYGSTGGSTTLNVCSNSGYGCAAIYVNVSGTSCTYSGCGNGTNISLSQTSLSLGGGQTSAVTVYGNGSYYISSNSNPYVATGLLAGNIVNVTAIQNGTTSIYVCQNGGSIQCATLYVTVGGNGYYTTTNVVLSPSSLSLSVGQTATVNASGNGGYGYYISSNSNPGSVSATFNGSVLTVYAIANGSSTLQICQNGASSCASLYVSVGGYAYSGGGTGVQYPGGGSSSVLGASTYANGELIAEGPTVYIVYRGTKTPFASAAAFTGFGFSFSNVVQVGSSGLPNSGHTITSSYSSHPWGSWIKNGSTVYFVQESGLIPIPNWDTFLNNGGSQNLIVNANSYDFRLPILSPMTANDPRLN